MTSTAEMNDLGVRVREGDVRAVARLISFVEDGPSRRREASRALGPHVNTAHIVGVTGPPGVGKSTLTGALVGAYRRTAKRVGVLAIDPSSSFTGGSLLGDRIRMQHHSEDPGVYIRSMATRGQLGGLASATAQASRVLGAAGFDVVIIETVGVGQSEIDIAGLADTTIVVQVPGMGDGIQAVKAGILEIGDLFVVNKADHDGANQVRRELRAMQNLTALSSEDWRPPILLTTASQNEGIDEVIADIERHREHAGASGELRRRRARRLRDEIQAIALTELRAKFTRCAGSKLEALTDEVLEGSRDPFDAADALIASL